MRLMLLFVASLLVSVSGCKKKMNANNYGLDKSNTIRLTLTTEPPTLDWTKSSDTSSSFLVDNIMDALVEYDYNSPTLELRPALASSWKANADNTEWEITLREDVIWNDGVPLTAQQVVDGWKRLLTPETASVYAYFLFSIVNAQEFNSGKIKDFNEVGVKISGHKIFVKLHTPTNFPYLLTHHSTLPVRLDVINKHGDRWTEPENIVTLGAYDIKIWDHDKAVVLKRNEKYYGEKAKTPNVLAIVIEEQGTALNLYNAKQVDALRELPSAMLKKLKTRDDFRMTPILNTYYYGFNTSRPPMDNVYLRRAIAAAIDNSQITKMLDGGQTPMTGWIPKGMLGYDESAGIKYDPEKALEYYKKAGYTKENPAPQFSLSFNTLDDHKRIAENVQAQLKRNLNISVEIKNEEWKVYLGTLRSNAAHMFRMGWVADYPDPHNFYELMSSFSDNNHTRWREKKFDHYLDQALRAKTEEEKLKAYQNAGRLLLFEGAAVKPIYSGAKHNLVSKRLKNFPSNPMDKYPLKEVEINEE